MLTPQTLNEIRAIATWALRALAILLIVGGLYLVLKRLIFGVLGAGELDQAWSSWTGVGEEHSLYRGVAMMLVGVPLTIFSSKLARWTIVVPAEGCPRCGYAADATSDRHCRCPECGLRGVRTPEGMKEQG